MSLSIYTVAKFPSRKHLAEERHSGLRCQLSVNYKRYGFGDWVGVCLAERPRLIVIATRLIIRGDEKRVLERGSSRAHRSIAQLQSAVASHIALIQRHGAKISLCRLF